jgi:hypothetical protein
VLTAEPAAVTYCIDARFSEALLKSGLADYGLMTRSKPRCFRLLVPPRSRQR